MKKSLIFVITILFIVVIFVVVRYNNMQTRIKETQKFNIQYEEASKVATLVGLYSGKFRPFKKEWFNPSQVDFSGYRFTAPSGYHEILSLLYGDYMHLPPEDERRSTHTDLFIWRI